MTCNTYSGTCVQDPIVETTSTPTVTPAHDQLPNTGFDVTTLVILGLMLIAAGAAMVVLLWKNKI